jgi:iron(III) transport system ATP-binding protein
MSDLEVVDVYKSFGPLMVLRGLDVSVTPGSFASILGPSGSGKTTLLRIVAGFERADRGTIRIGDQIADDGEHYLPPDRRRIGYVPQEGSLFPHLSIEQNVGFGIARRDRRGQKVADLLEMVGLGGMQRRYPHELSGGQQQRVALARALAVGPALVLLDEPFSSLDDSLRATVRQDVRRVLRELGATVVLVTHDQDEALSLSDKVAIMSNGAIGQYDTPTDIYRRPATPEIAKRLGDSNFVTGTLERDGVLTGLGLLELGGQPPTNGTSSLDTSVVVLVRPEQLSFSTETDRGAGTATVIDTEFYGHDAIVKLRPDWDQSTALIARTTDAANAPRPGTRVALAVHGKVSAWANEESPDSPLAT